MKQKRPSQTGMKVAKKRLSKPKVKIPTKKELADRELHRMLTTPMSQRAMLEGQPALQFKAGAMRLGFAVKVLGQPGLKSNDTRRWQQNPHLRVSLGFLCETLAYCRKHGIHMYRMASDIAPYATHPDLPRFHNQVEECSEDLRDFGRLAREQDLRLSFHPSQFIVLNSPDPQIRAKSVWDLQSQADILDRMELGPEAVMVIHAGGLYGDLQGGMDRWVETWGTLSEPIRRRLVLENDDIRYSAANVWAIHERTGVPLVFDHQHFCCLNPEGLLLRETVAKFVATWPTGVRPKIHFSSPRTEMREIIQKDRQTKKNRTVLVPPIWTGHADFINPFEFNQFFRQTGDLAFDVMLEAKAKDLALLRLRHDFLRFAPTFAHRFGASENEDTDEESEILTEAFAE